MSNSLAKSLWASDIEGDKTKRVLIWYEDMASTRLFGFKVEPNAGYRAKDELYMLGLAIASLHVVEGAIMIKWSKFFSPYSVNGACSSFGPLNVNLNPRATHRKNPSVQADRQQLNKHTFKALPEVRIARLLQCRFENDENPVSGCRLGVNRSQQLRGYQRLCEECQGLEFGPKHHLIMGLGKSNLGGLGAGRACIHHHGRTRPPARRVLAPQRAIGPRYYCTR